MGYSALSPPQACPWPPRHPPCLTPAFRDHLVKHCPTVCQALLGNLQKEDCEGETEAQGPDLPSDLPAWDLSNPAVLGPPFYNVLLKK